MDVSHDDVEKPKNPKPSFAESRDILRAQQTTPSLGGNRKLVKSYGAQTGSALKSVGGAVWREQYKRKDIL